MLGWNLSLCAYTGLLRDTVSSIKIFTSFPLKKESNFRVFFSILFSSILVCNYFQKRAQFLQNDLFFPLVLTANRMSPQTFILFCTKICIAFWLWYIHSGKTSTWNRVFCFSCKMFGYILAGVKAIYQIWQKGFCYNGARINLQWNYDLVVLST